MPPARSCLQPIPIRPHHSFLRAQDGVAAVEFAFIAPVMLLLVMGIVETSLILLTQSLMESATFNASRLGKTGYVPAGTTRQQAILDMIEQRTGRLVKPEHLTVESKVYGDFAQIGQPEPFTDRNGNGRWDINETYVDSNGNGQWDADMGTAGLGDADDVVVYTVSYPWRLYTPLIGMLFSPDGTYRLSVRAVVKNEPY